MLFGSPVGPSLFLPDFAGTLLDLLLQFACWITKRAGLANSGRLAATGGFLPERIIDRFSGRRRHIRRMTTAAYGIAAMFRSTKDQSISTR